MTAHPLEMLNNLAAAARHHTQVAIAVEQPIFDLAMLWDLLGPRIEDLFASGEPVSLSAAQAEALYHHLTRVGGLVAELVQAERAGAA